MTIETKNIKPINGMILVDPIIETIVDLGSGVTVVKRRKQYDSIEAIVVKSWDEKACMVKTGWKVFLKQTAGYDIPMQAKTMLMIYEDEVLGYEVPEK